MKRAAGAAYWAIPPLVCLAVHWTGLKIWFQQDDFAWLGLQLSIYDFQGLLRALFEPMAQGTIRTLSERAFFLVFTALFGIDPLPFRIWVLFTQMVNTVLLAAVVRRVSGSRLAGCAAPLLWMASAMIVVPLAWTSAYNQVLCSFFLLLSFWLWVRYTETERTKYLVAQWVSFVLGFGALEVNIVYPAIALAYALACARRHWKQTLPMFAASAGYFLLHWWASPKESAGVYGLHLDARILDTFWTYWTWALGTGRLLRLVAAPAWLPPLGTGLLTLALAAFTIHSAIRKKWLPLFFVGWYLITLAPVLPLPEHVTDYYLTAPLIGLSALMGVGLAAAWERGRPAGIAALLLACFYVGLNWPQVRITQHWWLDRGRQVRKVVLGVVQARKLHPGKAILVTGLHGDLFWASFYDDPFRLFGVRDVYVAPGTEKQIDYHPELGDIEDDVLPRAATLWLLKRDEAVVYDASGPLLRNITQIYGNDAVGNWPTPPPPKRIDAAKRFFGDQLGPEWYPAEGLFRRMPKRATVTLGGPQAGERLWLSFYCPQELVASGPAHMKVVVVGQQVGTAVLNDASRRLDLAFPLPAELAGRERIEVAIEVDRSSGSAPGASGAREYSLTFGTVEIKK